MGVARVALLRARAHWRCLRCRPRACWRGQRAGERQERRAVSVHAGHVMEAHPPPKELGACLHPQHSRPRHEVRHMRDLQSVRTPRMLSAWRPTRVLANQSKPRSGHGPRRAFPCLLSASQRQPMCLTTGGAYAGHPLFPLSLVALLCNDHWKAAATCPGRGSMHAAELPCSATCLRCFSLQPDCIQ